MFCFFFQVGLQSLNLGICPKLNVLHIKAPLMLLLELKGCGVLSEASIDCPRLTSLDASFCRSCCLFILSLLVFSGTEADTLLFCTCSQLKDDCLSATTGSCPRIESLVLMSCPSVGPDGLYSLRRLPHLTLLDLSYTFLVNLEPVFESCLQLRVIFKIPNMLFYLLNGACYHFYNILCICPSTLVRVMFLVI